MGGGNYSMQDSQFRTRAYAAKSRAESFVQRDINNAMSPHGIQLRESRDSTEHPASRPIIIGLDVTGSMGTVPEHMVKGGLHNIMSKVMQNAGIQDVQILFVAIGDHECDRCPLQVGQFESSDDLIDAWLSKTFLEEGGGGNGGESYLLAWYFAGYRTAHDSLEKRQKKGLLFTIGDEPTLRSIPKSVIKEIMGEGQYEDFSAATLLAKAQELYEVYHLHIRETSQGSRNTTIDGWRELLGENLRVIQHHDQVSDEIAHIATLHYGEVAANNNESVAPEMHSDPTLETNIEPML